MRPIIKKNLYLLKQDNKLLENMKTKAVKFQSLLMTKAAHKTFNNFM